MQSEVRRSVRTGKIKEEHTGCVGAKKWEGHGDIT